MHNELVESAKQVAPALAKTAAEDNTLRRLSDGTWKILLENGFVRSLQPARWGGGEVSLVEFIDAMMEIARVSPSAGWVAGVIGVHPWQLALFDDSTQQDMWDDAAHHDALVVLLPDRRRPHTSTVGYQTLRSLVVLWSGFDLSNGVNLGAVIPGAPEIGKKILPDFPLVPLAARPVPHRRQLVRRWVAGRPAARTSSSTGRSCRSTNHSGTLDYTFGKPLPGQERNVSSLYRLPWSVVFQHGVGLCRPWRGPRLCGHLGRADARTHPQLRRTRGR